MKILSLNCNGLRAAINKNLQDYILQNNFDIVCLQEIKANHNQIEQDFFTKIKLESYFFSAKKKGYSGVACFSNKKPIQIQYGLNHSLYDEEGRSILLQFENFTIWNLYFPSGTSGTLRQSVKMDFLEHFIKETELRKNEYKNLIICGDINIAHTEKDIHDPIRNKNTSGFLPEEREWLSKFLAQNWVDCFRFLYPEQQTYSWWSYRRKARTNNKGWRIDYFFVPLHLKNSIRSMTIDQEAFFSDHTSLILDIDL